jgi:hypothetical protein
MFLEVLVSKYSRGAAEVRILTGLAANANVIAEARIELSIDNLDEMLFYTIVSSGRAFVIPASTRLSGALRDCTMTQRARDVCLEILRVAIPNRPRAFLNGVKSRHGSKCLCP